MRKKIFKKKFTIFGTSLFIRVTYKKPQIFPEHFGLFGINKSFLYFILTILLLITSGYFIYSKVTIPVYPTKNAKILSSFSPNLSSVDENNTPPPPKNNENVILNGDRNKKEIALTFDADMTPEMKYFLLSGHVKSYYNKQIIDILNQTQTKATLFLTGMWMELYPNETKEFARNPLLELGNHSYSHPSFSGYCFGLPMIPLSQDKSEIEKTQKLLKDATGFTNDIFRFPGGCYSKQNLDIVTQENLKVVHWDVAGEDGFNNNIQNIEENVLNNVKDGSIIVLHINGYPNSPKTADALPLIISTLKNRGFTFVKVSELLGFGQKLISVNIRDYINERYGL